MNAPAQPLSHDADLARAESEGMVSEAAKLSSVEPPPEVHADPFTPPHPRAERRTDPAGAIAILMLVIGVVIAALVLSTTP